MTLLKLDPSLLKYFGCMRKVYYTSILGYRGAVPSQSIHIGSAFHTFMASLLSGASIVESTVDAVKYFDTRPYQLERRNVWKDAAYLAGMCQAFPAQEWPFKPALKEAVEMRLAVPYKQYQGAPWQEAVEVLLCGTADLLAEDDDGLILVDHKTTTSWEHEEFFNGYRLDIQFPFYMVIIRRTLEYMAPRDAECARLLEKLNAKGFSVVIHGVFMKKATAPVFKLSAPIRYPQSMLDEVEAMICSSADRLANLYFTGAPPREGIMTGVCHNKFGACPYERVCLLEPNEQELALKLAFTKSEYDPLKFGE